jgi:hypothetical protein
MIAGPHRKKEGCKNKQRQRSCRARTGSVNMTAVSRVSLRARLRPTLGSCRAGRDGLSPRRWATKDPAGPPTHLRTNRRRPLVAALRERRLARSQEGAGEEQEAKKRA